MVATGVATAVAAVETDATLGNTKQVSTQNSALVAEFCVIHIENYDASVSRYNARMTMIMKALGWGIAIYAIMYLVWSGLVIYGFDAGIPSLIVRLGVLAMVTSIAARSLRVISWADLLPYTIGWALVAILCDIVFLIPFSGWSLFAGWSVWVGYFLVAIIPLLTSMIKLPNRRPTSISA